jgi:hypothetical protein
MNGARATLAAAGTRPPLARRADAGTVRLGNRDVAGLLLCGDMYSAPYDLVAEFLGVRPDRLRGIVAHWRRAGYVQTGRLGPGPAWCWLTRSGLAVTGQRYALARPALGRLAHIRAVLVVRLSLQDSEAYRDGRAWWRSERHIRAAAGGRVGISHVPDAEVSWPDLTGSGYAGECWAIEAELTPKPLARTTAIMSGLLTRTADNQPTAQPGPAPRYHRVVYLAAPAARGGRPRRRRLARSATVPAGGAGPAAGSGAVMWWYLRARFTLWLLRAAGRVIRWAVLGAMLVAAGPVTIVAAVGFAGGVAARLAAGPAAPRRLLGAADDRRLPGRVRGTGRYLAGVRAGARARLAGRLAPGAGRAHGHRVRADRFGGGLGRARRCGRAVGVAVYVIETGLSGRTATAPVVFDARQWRRASRAARGRVTAPGTFPLATGRGRVVMGATIRAVGHRWRPVTAVPCSAPKSPRSLIPGPAGSAKLPANLADRGHQMQIARFKFQETLGYCPNTRR